MNKIVIVVVLLILVFAISSMLSSKDTTGSETSTATTTPETITQSANTDVLSGTVLYRERIAMPEGSKIVVQILDTSLADAPATLIAEDIIITEGENVPVPFTIDYNADTLVEGHTYTISAKIFFPEDELRFITDTATFLLDENRVAVDEVELLLVGVQPPVDDAELAPEMR